MTNNLPLLALPHSIFADKASVDAAATEIVFESVGMITLKGKGLVQSFKVNGLKFKGSILSDQNENSDMSSPPQMFDNMASIHSAILLDWAVQTSKTTAKIGFEGFGGSESVSPNKAGTPGSSSSPTKVRSDEERYTARLPI